MQPSLLFGPEPAHTWCYYFEKADLARQYADWSTAAALGDEARAKGYRPDRSGSDSAYAWMPFLEAYAYLARWQDVIDLTQQTLEHTPSAAPFICSRWNSWSTQAAPSAEWSAANQTLQGAACTGD